jgi:exodeoxyribonuclease V gamma subunit
MPIHLQFAPSANLLLEHLLTSLRTVWTDPFEPPTLMVPNPALGRWLRLRLADQPTTGFGSVLSLDTTTLERYLWEALQPDSDMQRLDVNTFSQVLDSLLNAQTCAEPVFAPVRQYLVGPEGLVDPLRRVQLASRLARMFQEYEFNRPSVGNHEGKGWRLPGIDAKWAQGQSFFTDGLANEAWQMALYNRAQEFLCQPIQGNRLISLPHLHRLRREKGCADGSPWKVSAGSVFMFQLAKISHFHRNILIEISQMPGVDLRVFLTNPCAEFWEDVDTWRSRTPQRSWNSASRNAAISSRRPEDYQKSELNEIVTQPSEHPLLQLWGHTGKENIYLWCPASQWNFEYHSPTRAEQEQPPATLLEAVQLSLLRRQSALEPSASGSSWVGDYSLQILETPDRTREVEELRSQILTIVSNGRVKRLEEIVVYLTDPGAYLSSIQRVFGAYMPWDPRHIPFAVLGVPGSDSLFAQGMQAMLALVAGGFDRANVFTVLRNPIVQATQGFTPEDVTIWEHWAAELGIFRGYDKEHRERMGDAPTYASEAHTFSLGMARLLVGNLASGSVELGYGSPLPVYRDYDSSEASLLARFCAIMERLHLECSLDLEAGVSLTVQKISELSELWFREFPATLGEKRAGEARIKKEFLDALGTIALQETLCARTDLGKDELLGLVKACLPDELPSSSKAWTGGVTFAPLRQGMVLPHAAVFVLGLDAAAFPGMNRVTPFDLIAQQRILGDSDPVRENRFSFLELIHAAQNILVLSYRARNMQKEELLQPSSMVLELEA